MTRRQITWSAVVVLAMAVGRADAQVVRQATSDAWWTGPLLANSAATLPHGHFLVESYLYDVISRGQFDQGRIRQGVPRSDSYGSQSYLLYGLVDRFSIGLVPNFGFISGSERPNSSHVGAGDLGVMTQLRLTESDPHSRMPTISINVQETLPTGKYDRLERVFDGLGSGVYTTTLSLYSQKYFWLPTGRILRMRLNVSQAFSGHASVEDASVYGTESGFRGEVRPGQTTYVNGAWEYSMSRRWVAALDATYRHARSTQVTGYTPSLVTTSAPSDAVGLAPAVEYNWSGNVGVIFGTRLIVAGRNASATITPAVAINIVH
ncbi:MAG: transporter [Gemmatimonadaceae bacterium]